MAGGSLAVVIEGAGWLTMELLSDDEVRRLQSLPLTYAEVGESLNLVLPGGFRAVRRQRACPDAVDFDTARRALFAWEVHERAGLRVHASGPVAVGAVVRLGVRIGLIVVAHAPCRVVEVIDEPGRAGFAYGTLPGHPESGEELFEIATCHGRPAVRITAFSRPARLGARLAGPFARLVQDRITERYLRALD